MTRRFRALVAHPQVEALGELAEMAGVSTSVVKGLVKQGVVAEEESPRDLPYGQLDPGQSSYDLTGEQADAAKFLREGVKARRYGTALLKGVTLVGENRQQDLAARYGGEEMVLVLPGTAKQVASAIAESIRRAIAARPVPVGKVAIPVSASIGVATYESGCPLISSAHLLKAADLVRCERRGQQMVYSLNTTVFEAVADLLLDLFRVDKRKGERR